ncbi:MAG: hypothetical protein JO247_22780 [Chloroflexi bacterium]|nr:hypothetical protein [Chloroflexota bacterium]
MNFASRTEWLAALNTRELVILLMELQQVRLEQPQLAGEVDDACEALREELLQRERPVHAA